MDDESPSEVLLLVERICNSGFNLLQALPPTTLGRAISTGMIDSSYIVEWGQQSTNIPCEASKVEPQRRRSRSPRQTGGRSASSPAPVQQSGVVMSYWGLGPTPPPSAKTRVVQSDEITAETYADLRLSVPPTDPHLMASQFNQKCASLPTMEPADLTKTYVYPRPDGSPRDARWAFWQRLSTIGVLVKPYFMGTEWEHYSNAGIGSNTTGQEVVRTAAGTVMWCSASGRILTPNGSRALLLRLRVAFSTLDAESSDYRSAPRPNRDFRNSHSKGGY
jgi:hypothetical protein